MAHPCPSGPLAATTIAGGDEAVRPPLVVFSGVHKSFDGRTRVIDNLDLSIRRGEFLTLLGPSGSGKTTTLMMLAGFETPTDGDIQLGGRSIKNLPPHRRGIGVVFQNYALFPHMTVAENVAFPLTVRRVGRTEITLRVERALAMVKLSGLGRRLPSQLSGGQQQRVALARALVFEPELVLMDEPLGALDKKLREHMQIEIKHLHERLGVTVVYVTHDQGEALTMSDRVAVFNEGRIEQIDVPAALYELPRSSFVAQFVGETNLLHGRVVSVDGERCQVRLQDGTVVAARPVRVEGPGSRTTLSLRPERIHLSADGVGQENCLPGLIRETIYHGDHLRVRVTVAGAEDFMVKLRLDGTPTAQLPGGRCTVGFAAADCLALDPAGLVGPKSGP